MTSLKPMSDPYEPTPEGFHQRIERKLTQLQRGGAPARRSYRRIAALAACAVLLCGTAIALDRFGVLYFLTERIYAGGPADAGAVAKPVSQRCDSALLDASVRDAYWDGDTLSVALHVKPKADYAFYTETDRGQDGENFDQIWWKGEILPYDEWRAGRPGLMLLLPRMEVNGADTLASWDWVQDEQGETMLLECAADDLTNGAELTITLRCAREDTGETETATLSAALPPMTKD